MMRPEVCRLLREISAAKTVPEVKDLWWLAFQVHPFEEHELEAIVNAIDELPFKEGIGG
jgi:hypothetical protein